MVVKELTKAHIILLTLSAVTASVAVLSTIRTLLAAPTLAILLLFTSMVIGDKPLVEASIAVDKHRVHVGEEFEVTVNVNVKGGFGLILLRMPPHPNTQEALSLELASGNNVHVVFKGIRPINRTFKYRLRPVRRGRVQVRGIYYSYYQVLGLRRVTDGLIDVGELVEVMPNVKVASRPITGIRPINIRPQVPQIAIGPPSVDFRYVRRYEWGDPYKFINWKATARRVDGEVMVNEYEREGLRTVLFILDSGRWMRYGTWEENPLEYSIVAILSLTRLLLRRGLNVGLWSTSGIYVYPGFGMGHYYKVLRALIDVETRYTTYRVSPEVLALINRLRPIIVLFTNLTSSNAPFIRTLLGKVPSWGVVVDVIPHSIVFRSVVGVECVKGISRAKAKLYKMIPSRFTIVSWDPPCDGLGRVVFRVLTRVTPR